MCLNSLTMKASRYVDILGVGLNSVTFQEGSPGRGLESRHGACKCVGFLPCTPVQGKPRAARLTFGKHVRQSCEVGGVDEGDVKYGLHVWLIEAGEGLPGIRSLHLRCGHHSVQIRVLERVLQKKGCMEACPNLLTALHPTPRSCRTLVNKLPQETKASRLHPNPGRLHACVS